ncbi:hypothetical protein [Vampirovibrio chlorellavorus]|uniref:hypothetical protein n=1 Tax=Vampirovibrio chlorellavorus TaxID=758823 RepID=UPI0026F2B7BB|nr:hypothetical protein [Vampirovibrio chlorellavorus]
MNVNSHSMSSLPLQQPRQLAGAVVRSQVNRPASVQFGGGSTTGISLGTAWQTLRSHFSNKNNPQVAKAFVKKYGTDVVFPALFTIPVVGWALGILGMPVAGYLSKKGDKALETYTKDPSLQNHPAVRAEEIANHWNKDTVSFNELSTRWNNFIGSLFPAKPGSADFENNQKIQKKLQISEKTKGSWLYRNLAKLVNAKNALTKSWVRFLAAPFTLIHKGLQKINCPSALRKVFLLPRFALLALFFLLEKAPK